MTDRKNGTRSDTTAAESVEPGKEKGNTKDRTAKVLLSLNEVFSNAINVLCCGGKKVMAADELTEAQTLSRYKTSQKLREQSRDVAKIWEKAGMRVLMLGIEHQSTSLKHMVVRAFSYDAAEYMRQITDAEEETLTQNGRKVKKKREIYPVITVVISFSTKRWTAPRTLKEYLKDSLWKVPDELKPLVQDYRLNVIEFAYLTDEQIEMLHPDLREVALLLRSQRLGFKRPRLANENLRHPQETIELLFALMGKSKQADAAIDKFFETHDKERITMDNIFDELLAEGEAKGRDEGIIIGEQKGRAEGRAELCEEIARQMKKDNIDLSYISKITTLSAERIAQL